MDVIARSHVSSSPLQTHPRAKLLSTILLSGCTGLGGVGSEDLGLVVESDAGHAMIHSSFEDGSQTSVTYPSVTFDFSESTNYGQGTLFGVDLGDGSEPVTIDSSESTKISIEFANHGLYSVGACLELTCVIMH